MAVRSLQVTTRSVLLQKTDSGILSYDRKQLRLKKQCLILNTDLVYSLLLLQERRAALNKHSAYEVSLRK